MGIFSGRRDVKRHARRTGWIAVAILVLTLGMVGIAPAAMTVGGTAPSATEAALLEENPALAAVAATSPDQLRGVLDRLAKLIANPSDARGGLKELDEEDFRLLQQNPALFQAWRSSPEASADLLELIRVAAGGKPRK